MKRFEWQNDGMVVVGAELEYAPMDTHEFVVYEEARLIEVDRDIKAANLQLLVEKVLAWEIADQAFFDVAGADYYPTSDDPDAVETAGNVVGDAQQEMVDLARSLKQ